MMKLQVSLRMRLQFTAILVSCLSATTVQAQWELVTDTMRAQLHAVDFYDGQFGIAAGRGLVLKTEDGGLSWTVSDTTYRDIDFRGVVIDSTVVGPVALVFGSDLTILRSADRGKSWKRVHSSVSVRLQTACSLGDGRFSVFGDGGWAAESIDTGLSWETRLIFPSTDVAASACPPTGTIWLGGFSSKVGVNQCCGVLLRSDNGGQTWTKVNELIDIRNGYFNAVDFVSDSIGFAVSTTNRFTTRSFFWKTVDGGQEWELKSQFHEVRALDFVDEQIGAMVGSEGYILWTEDGGEHWVEHPAPTPYHLYDVILLDSQTAIAVGDVFIVRNATGASVAIEPEVVPMRPLRHWAYPNPSVSSVTVSFETDEPILGNLHVTDILGRQVSARIDRHSTGSSFSFGISVDNLPGGIYFYSVTTGDRTASGSFLVAR